VTFTTEDNYFVLDRGGPDPPAESETCPWRLGVGLGKFLALL